MATEEVTLIDGLVGAALLQPRGSIRRHDDQRQTCALGLEHGRQGVGRRGAGGREHQRRTSRDARDPEAEEGGHTFVDVVVEAQPWLLRRGEHERSGARTWAEDDVLHARVREGGEERARDGGLGAQARPPSPASAARAARTARILSSVSAYSAAACEPSTMPAPA